MPTVYVETSIPSYYFETRSDLRIKAWRAVTRQWWDQYRFRYSLVTSRFVLQELGKAPAPKAEACVQLLEEAVLLEEPSGLADVIEFYVQHKLMPSDAIGDAAHLAMASLHSVDFLLTWNCRHLANANKTRHLSVLNGRLGLPVPAITTPWTLSPEE